MKSFYKLLLLSCLGLSISHSADARMSQDDPEILIKDGHFFGEIRYRYETVEQAGFSEDANANTVRTNIGFKTGIYNGLQALIEGQVVQGLGDEDYNNTTNGQTAFPIVADPDVAEINQLWFAWSGLPETTFTAGRQKMNLDNQRFVGTVGWRQNDQTFDAIHIENKTIENLSLLYSYIGNVNRIQGGDNILGDLDSDIHIANISYKFNNWLKLTGYGYWLDFDESAANSSETYGLRATGWMPINNDWKFTYEAELATQQDHGDNATNYDEEYYHIAPAIKGYGFTLKAGYEFLGGDGTGSFRTPLATGHKFNGWADAFLTTPDEGLEDTYVGASYKISDTNSFFDNMKFSATYHDFDSDASTVGDFGDELDLSIGKTFTLPDGGQPFKKLNVLLKYADYNGETSAGADNDREKIWLQLGVKF